MVKDALDPKKDPEFSDEKNVIAVFRAEKKKGLDPLEIKQRMHYGFKKKVEDIKTTKTGYIISLMYNFNPPVQEASINDFNNFEQNEYDFDQLEDELLRNYVEESDSE